MFASLMGDPLMAGELSAWRAATNGNRLRADPAPPARSRFWRHRFQQRHIAGRTEGEGQLALEGVVRRGLPATERRIRQQIQAIAGGIPCSLVGGSVTA